MELMQIQHLSKVYGQGENQVRAVDDISFTVEKGEFLAIIGPSGSGKSTLLHILGGVDRPTSGKVFVDGQDVYAQNEDQLAIFRRRQVGLIYQFYNLIPVLNVVENMTLPVLMDGRQVNQERLEELLDVLGLRGREKYLPNQLSGGQQQRVSIARALAGDPAVILADEPTGALDSHTGREVLTMLQQLHAAGNTVVLITHEMAVIRQICNKVAILDGGKLAEQGTVDDVFMHTKSAAGRRLFGILPEQEEIPPQPAIRIVFDGEAAEKPIISKLVKDCGLDVNILSADIRQLNQKAYGQMLIARPQDPEDVKRVMEYLALEGLTVEEVHVP